MNVNDDGSITREKEAEVDLTKAAPSTPIVEEAPVTTDPSLTKAIDTTVKHDIAEMTNAGVAVFVPFVKINKEKRLVSGIACKQEIDSDGDILLFDAVESAVPGFMEFGNIREMHQLSAVGVVTQHKLMPDEKAWWIEVKVVDDAAWEKVLSGVYKGFSLGGTILAVDPLEGTDMRGTPLRWNITRIRINEVSLVDRPASPSALIDMIKAGKQMGDVKKSFIMQGAVIINDPELTKATDTHKLGTSHLQVHKYEPSILLLSKLQTMSNPTTLEKALKSATDQLLEKGVDLTKADTKAEFGSTEIAELISLGAEHGIAMAKADATAEIEAAKVIEAPELKKADDPETPETPAPVPANDDLAKAVAAAVTAAVAPMAEGLKNVAEKLEKATQGTSTQTPEELAKADAAKAVAQGSFKGMFIKN